jgi:hypothetical protein
MFAANGEPTVERAAVDPRPRDRQMLMGACVSGAVPPDNAAVPAASATDALIAVFSWPGGKESAIEQRHSAQPGLRASDRNVHAMSGQIE